MKINKTVSMAMISLSVLTGGCSRSVIKTINIAEKSFPKVEQNLFRIDSLPKLNQDVFMKNLVHEADGTLVASRDTFFLNPLSKR